MGSGCSCGYCKSASELDSTTAQVYDEIGAKNTKSDLSGKGIHNPEIGVKVTFKESDKISHKVLQNKLKKSKKFHNSAGPRHSAFLNRTIITMCVLGEKKVGKTSFMNKFIRNTFSEDYNPSTEKEKKEKRYSFKNRIYDIQMTIPSDPTNPITIDNYEFVLVLYDVNNLDTFTSAEKILEKLLKENKKLKNVILVGNKNDLEKQIKEEAINQVKSKYKVNYFDINAKEGKGIPQLISELVQEFDKSAFTFV